MNASMLTQEATQSAQSEVTESCLWDRERDPKMLEGLQKRIASLFLQLIEDPVFNSEARALHPPQPPAYRHAAALPGYTVLDAKPRAPIASC
jgi:hypothetical protein